MLSRSAGLQTHIWNNNLKSIILLGIYPFVIFGVVWACALAIGYFTLPAGNPRLDQADKVISFSNTLIYDYFPIILAVIIGWFVISFFFHTRMIANMAHAHSVSRKEEPDLYNLLENLCISKGMKMPKMNIIESHALNAFASGISDNSYTVTVTRGLLNRLNKDEVEAVLAHELTHIINHDVRLLMVTIVFTGMVGLAAQLVWSNVRYSLYFPRGGSNNKKGNGIILLLVILAILWLGYFATLFMRFALSRRREYMADAGAIQMTRNPDAMMRALMRISGRDQIPEATADIAFMCIENTAPFMGLFSTHPPIDKRIQAISVSTGSQIPDTLPPVSENALSGNRKDAWLPRDRHFRKKRNPWLSKD